MTTKKTPPGDIALIHVFRAGTHTAMSGERIAFSEADLAASVAAYDPGLHEAPMVVGHPELDAPAYGWIKGLMMRDGDLYAQVHQVDPAFAELVNDGKYKKCSIKWYRPEDSVNPKPGVWYPRHVGFMGAQPPAIKGLRTVQFADDAEGVEFAEWSERTVARMFRRLREWLIGQHGQEVADRIIHPDELDFLVSEAVTLPETTAAFTEKPKEEKTVTEEEKAALSAENEALKRQLAEEKAKTKAAAITARKADAVQFCEGLIVEGKVLPAEKDTVVGLLMLTGESQPVQFGEGDGAVTEAPRVRLETLLKLLPKRIEFSEIARPASAAKAPVQFAAAPGMPVDTEGLDTHAKAVAYQQLHKVDYVTAVKAIQAT